MAKKAAEAATTIPPAEPQFGRVPIDQILVPEEHRRPLGDIEELAQTIGQEGMLQPIIVRQTEAGFELMAGWRRLNAAQALGWTEIPVQVRGADDTTRRVVRTIENVQRLNLSAVQEAEEYARLQEQDGLEAHQIGKRVGRSPLHVTNRLMLLTLPEEMRAKVGVLGGLTIGDATELARISEHPEQLQAAYKAVQAGTPAGNAVQTQLGKLAKLTEIEKAKKVITDRGDTVFEGVIGHDGFAVINDEPHPGCLFWPYQTDAEDFEYGVSAEAEEFPVVTSPTLHLNDPDPRVRESARALLQVAEKGTMEAPAQPLTEDEAAKRAEAGERKHWKELRKRAELRQVHLTKVARGGPKAADVELVQRAYVDSLLPAVRDAVLARCNVPRVENPNGFGEVWDLEGWLGGQRGSWAKLARAAALEQHERAMEQHIKSKTRLLHGVEAEQAGRYLEYLEGTGYALSPQECELAGLEREPESAEPEAESEPAE
jgi:ParB family transcriptional regulator, chromosome partitioning protein